MITSITEADALPHGPEGSGCTHRMLVARKRALYQWQAGCTTCAAIGPLSHNGTGALNAFRALYGRTYVVGARAVCR